MGLLAKRRQGFGVLTESFAKVALLVPMACLAILLLGASTCLNFNFTICFVAVQAWSVIFGPTPA